MSSSPASSSPASGSKPSDQPASSTQETTGTIIRSNAFDKSILGGGLAYKGWTGATVMAALSVHAAPAVVLLDTGSTASLVGREFLQAQAPDLPISTLKESIELYGVDTRTCLETQQYVTCDVYLPGIKSGVKATSVIRCELHIVDNTDTTILLGMDVIAPERILINAACHIARIGSTQASVLLKTETPVRKMIRDITRELEQMKEVEAENARLKSENAALLKMREAGKAASSGSPEGKDSA